MKRFYFLVLATFGFVTVFAQTESASKIYGYKQKIKPGTVRVDDSGREMPGRPLYNYFISLASSTKVVPLEIWLNKEAYSVMITEVKATPVEYISPATIGKRRTLVPGTTKKVLQLSPSSNKINKPSQKGKTLSAKNELVVIYKISGKCYYKAIAKLSELDSVDMQ
jgi:hypothetical protein